MKRTLTSTALLSALMVLGGVVHAQNLTWYNNIFIIGDQGQVGWVLQLIDGLVPVLTLVALALAMWGAILFVAKSDDETAREEGKKKMIWGVVGLMVIVSVWGLVFLVQRTVGIQSPGTGGVDVQFAPKICGLTACPD
jgi:hypothetical protein